MNIIIAFITITFIFYWIDYFCNYETYSNEGVQNLNKVYNTKKLIINNLNIKNNLNVNGELECYGNGTFGNAKLGNWESDKNYALLSHKNKTENDYGIIQSDKHTILNSAEDSSVYIKNNNTNNLEITKDDIKFNDSQFNLKKYDFTFCPNYNKDEPIDGKCGPLIQESDYDTNWIPIISNMRGAFNDNNAAFFHYDGSVYDNYGGCPSPNKKLVFSGCQTINDYGMSTCSSITCDTNANISRLTNSIYIPKPLVNRIDDIQIT
jgi:hypothetical protein